MSSCRDALSSFYISERSCGHAPTSFEIAKCACHVSPSFVFDMCNGTDVPEETWRPMYENGLKIQEDGCRRIGSASTISAITTTETTKPLSSACQTALTEVSRASRECFQIPDSESPSKCYCTALNPESIYTSCYVHNDRSLWYPTYRQTASARDAYCK
ncbi:hypothetical protein HDU79_008086 [Rhizoclosmatium sp. JEL0117]|nr:hypothetical protein HDU79_008086 [Rhizoclosmatium sp. JEL0117]